MPLHSDASGPGPSDLQPAKNTAKNLNQELKSPNSSSSKSPNSKDTTTSNSNLASKSSSKDLNSGSKSLNTSSPNSGPRSPVPKSPSKDDDQDQEDQDQSKLASSWREVKSKKGKSRRSKDKVTMMSSSTNKKSNNKKSQLNYDDELEFQFDEDFDSVSSFTGKKNQFSQRDDNYQDDDGNSGYDDEHGNGFTDGNDADGNDSDYEISDNELSKIIIVTQRPMKHDGYDRTGAGYQTRAKITSELGKIINDGLFYYEHDMLRRHCQRHGCQHAQDHHHHHQTESSSSRPKTVELISQEAFDKYFVDRSKIQKPKSQPPPPPPPPTFQESFFTEHVSGKFILLITNLINSLIMRYHHAFPIFEAILYNLVDMMIAHR